MKLMRRVDLLMPAAPPEVLAALEAILRRIRQAQDRVLEDDD